MARLNIYLPGELKARMDEVGDDVNWSEVARPAIQAAVADHERRRNRNMSSVIERLRASKQEAEQEDREIGKAAGRGWAEDTATYKELLRVSKLNVNEIDKDRLFTTLTRAINPDGATVSDFARSNSAQVHLRLIRPGMSITDALVAGFIEGAQEVFHEVEDQL